MTDVENPVIQRYLKKFETNLGTVEAAERAEVVREIDNHIAEALHEGADLSTLLQQLGPADRLAQAYRAELTLNAEPQASWWTRYGRFSLLLATTSLPSFLIVLTLTLFGPFLMLLGLFSMLVGPFNLLFPGIVELSAPWPSPLAEMSVFAFGILLVMAGTLGLGSLLLYLRMMRRLFRRALIRVRTTAG